MSTNAPRGWKARLLLRSALTLTALFAALFSGWSQSAAWNPAGFPFLCEGESLTLNPLISGLSGPYTFELKYDGLAQDVFGTDLELQPSYTVEALTPGLYEFVLFATNGVTNVFDTLEVEVVPLVAANLALANLDAGFEEIQNAGEPTLFRYCSNTAAVDMVFDVSFDGPIDLTTASVVIDWGDLTESNQSDFVGSTVSHNYAPGSWQIQVTVTNVGDLGLPCSETTVFNVFVGTAPQAGVVLASDKLCLSNSPVAEILLLNSSLTLVTWEILFTDDTPMYTETTDQDSVNFPHTFTRSSCGDSLVTDFGTLYDGFFVSALASNACGFTAFGNLGPFEVSVPPLLSIASDVGAVICPNAPVGLSNASTPPTLTTGFGCTEDYTFRWELDPAITLLGGDLGSDNGSPNQPESWSSGDMEIEVTSDVPGTHQIALITYTNTACGGDTALFDLTIAEAGVLALEDAAGDEFLSQEVCSGARLEDFTFSVEPASYDITWTVLDADSIPVALGQVPGIDSVAGMSTGTASPSNGWALTNTDTTAFTILVEAMIPCAASEPLIHEIVVFPEPAIVASPLDSTICSGVTTDIVLEINTNDAIEWNFTAGPELSGPGSFGPGFAITDTWTNNGLTVDTVLYEIFAASGSQCEGDTVDVRVRVLPQILAGPFDDLNLCPGDTAQPTPTPPIEGVEWSWVIDNVDLGLDSAGLGDVPMWTATNLGTESIEGLVTIFGEAGTCGPLEAGSFNVLVHPIPQAEVTVSPNGSLSCIDSLATIEWTILTDSTELIGFDGGSILTADSLLFDLGSAVVDAAGTYIMTLFSTDDGCPPATQEVVVNPIDDIAITDVLAMNPLCFEEASGAIEVLTDETGFVFYAWTGPSEATDNLATDLLAGDYFVTAINAAGCQDTASVTLSDPEALEVFITDSLKSECGEDNGYLVADAMGGSGALSYTWSGANNESLTLEGIGAGTYTFAAEDANGCVTDTAVFLDCIPLPVPLPSQFISPNGDNKNDLWTIENMVYFSDAKIQVFNRWGIEVFSTEGRYLGDWAGTNKDGKTLPSATYFYVIDTKKKSQRPFNGYLELQTNQP